MGKMRNKIKEKYWVLIDDYKCIRDIFPYVTWALKEKDKMGWGKVVEVEITIIGEEKDWSNP